MYHRPVRPQGSLLVLRLTALCIGLAFAITPPPSASAQSDGITDSVVLGVDRSGSMAGLDRAGHDRTVNYVSKLLFEGFEVDQVQPPDEIVVPRGGTSLSDSDRRLLSEGLANLDNDVEVFWFSDTVVDQGVVNSPAELDRTYPNFDEMDGQTHLGDALERALASFDSFSGIQTVHYVSVSDDILEASSPNMDDEQRVKVLQLQSEHPSRLILSLTVSSQSDDSQDSIKLVHISVRQYYSREQVEQLRAQLKEAVPALEERARDPQAAPSDILDELAELRGDITALREVLTSVGESVYGTDIGQIREELNELARRVEAVEALISEPASFSLVAPPPDASVPEGEIHFEWEPSARATTYELVLRSEGGMPSTMPVDGAQTEFTEALSAGVYHWKVRAIGKRSNSSTENSEGWRELTVEAGGPSIVLLEPPDDGELAAETVTFSWESESSLSSYTLAIEDATGQQKRNESVNTSIEVPLDSGSYTWWIESPDGDGSDDSRLSEVRSLQVLAQSTQDQLEPEAPTSGATVRPGTVHFAWLEPPSVITRTVTVSRLRGAQDMDQVIRQPVSDNTLDIALERGAFTWSVSALDAAGKTHLLAGAPVRFTVGDPLTWPRRYTMLCGTLLVLLAAVIVIYVRRQNPIYIKLESRSGTPAEPEQFQLGLNPRNNHIFLDQDQASEDDQVFDLGVPGAYIERSLLRGVRLFEPEADSGKPVRWEEEMQLGQGSAQLVVRRVSEDEGSNSP